MKLKIDIDKCIGCGACAAGCPQEFEIKDDGKSHLISPTGKVGNVEEKEIASATEEMKYAQENCPVMATKIE